MFKLFHKGHTVTLFWSPPLPLFVSLIGSIHMFIGIFVVVFLPPQEPYGKTKYCMTIEGILPTLSLFIALFS